MEETGENIMPEKWATYIITSQLPEWQTTLNPITRAEIIENMILLMALLSHY